MGGRVCGMLVLSLAMGICGPATDLRAEDGTRIAHAVLLTINQGR